MTRTMNCQTIFGWRLEKVDKSRLIILALGSVCICVWYMLFVWLYVSNSTNTSTTIIKERENTKQNVRYILGDSDWTALRGCQDTENVVPGDNFALKRRPTVAIGCAVREGGYTTMLLYLMPPRQWLNMPFLYIMFLSFLNTATPDYDYHFYVAYDHDDVTMRAAVRGGYLVENADKASKYTMSLLNRSWKLNYTFHFVECPYSGKPAWAQNDAMLAAYLDHHDYYYRVNDDSDMASFHWTEEFISTLQEFEPANIGVVGPRHVGGKRNILTHDFVHRSHIDIFGYYYPRELPDWYSDDWISAIYGPRRTRKMKNVKVKHWIGKIVTRYTPHPERINILNTLVWRDKQIIKKLVNN